MSVADPQYRDGSATAPSNVFPLPLTVIESFMVQDQRAAYPMMCDFELHFQGCIDRAAFESGLAFAARRNRLLTARVEPLTKDRLAWIPTDRLPPVNWCSLADPIGDEYGALTDLTVDPGLRIWVRQGHDRSIVLLNFHHACSDAIGMCAFLEDLLAEYARAVPGSDPVEPRKLEPARLLGRDEIGLAGRGWWRRIGDTVAGAREGAKFFLQKPVPLAAPAGSPPGDARPVRPEFITGVCPKEVLASLRASASASKATVNDVMLRDLFLVLRRWNSDQSDPPGRRRLRILMPQNLRRRDDGWMPAANLMSFAFLTRSADWCERPAELLDSLREETEAVRRGQLSLYFTGGLASVQRAGMLPRVLNSRLCFATAVLTNLGNPLRHFVTRFPRASSGLVTGNLILETIVGVPPVRPHTHVAFSIASGMDRLSISLKWDPHVLTAATAQILLDRYLAQLQVTALGTPTS